MKMKRFATLQTTSTTTSSSTEVVDVMSSLTSKSQQMDTLVPSSQPKPQYQKLQQRRLVATNRPILSITILLLLTIYNIHNNLIQYVISQNIVGTDICACQPSTYQLILNLSLSCEETTVNGTIPGIVEPACLIESRGATENITNPYPITIGSIIISELDQNLQVVGQATYRGPYISGQIIEYTSIIITDPTDINNITLPRGFQVVLTGLNTLEETLTNTWVITYDNDCSIFPLLTKGEQIGWTIFGVLGDPPQEFCPVAPPPSPTTQSQLPSDIVSPSPSSIITSITNDITLMPSIPTTTNITMSPTSIVSDVPTTMTMSPTSVVIDVPTNEMKPTCPPLDQSNNNNDGDDSTTKKKKGKDNKNDNKKRRRLSVGRRPSPAPTSCPDNDEPKTIRKKKISSSSTDDDSNDNNDDVQGPSIIGSEKDKDLTSTTTSNKKNKRKVVPEDRHDPTILDDYDDDMYV